MSDPAIQAALAAVADNRQTDAMAQLQRAGPRLADDPLALQIWSLALEGQDHAATALALLQRAARIAPGDAQAHFNLGVQLQAANDLTAAIARYNHALRLAPDHLGALNNLSDLYRRRGRSEEGYRLMQQFLAKGGPAAGQELRLAKLALDTCRSQEALAWFAAAEEAAPFDPHTAFERAMALLMAEQWEEGWARYEARLAVYGAAGLAMASYSLPPWEGRTKGPVLIHREQGLGDTIMFAAAIPDMIEEGIIPHLAQAPSLHRLFAESFPKAKVWSSETVIGASEQPPQPWLQVCGPLAAAAPVCSLGALRMPTGPPRAKAYLRAPRSELGAWAERLEALSPKTRGARRIGLCFAARRPSLRLPGTVDGEAKSISAAELAPLAESPHTTWFSLHDATTAPLLADAAGLEIVDLSSWITDFADTAAVIAQLDLVITVDTAVAHLAGAMGAPTWLLLRRQADWRWGWDRQDAVWYPGMKVFRQSKDGDWRDVIAAVARLLS